VLILSEDDVSPSRVWYKVRLSILPNNSTGWVPRSALGNIYVVHTHLYVNREAQTLVLEKDGKTIFKTRVGVGKAAPGWGPTPAGQFYIRDKLTNFNDPFYGPLAFGTSARSAVLTDWPGGGFIGVHGTNTPGLIPGYVSHGCIRLVNSAILKLARLMKVGTPLTVT
jgi:lipoprotein-anchoring transpeptidase ErfK/SrfK